MKNRTNLKILGEDQYLLVLYKPSKLVTMGNMGEDSLYARALNYLQKKSDEKLYCCHRLDKETEGIVVMAKGHHAKKAMDDLFYKRKVFKEYLAIVPSGIKELFDQSKWKDEDRKFLKILKEKNELWLEITLPIYGIKTRSHVSFEKGQSAYTKFCIVSENEDSSQLRVQLKSGRFHQIRCHLSHLGYPLLGDSVYGSKIKIDLSLIAHEISFLFPLNKKNYRFKI